MNGIKMSDCRFYTDEEAQTVVCVIAGENIRNMLINFVHENFYFNDICIDWAINSRFYETLEMPRSFMGKAVCSDDDEWDEEAGKLLAFKRAKTKLYNSFFKRANMLMRALDTRLDNMVEAFGQLGLKIEDNMNSIDKRLEEKQIYIPDHDENG
jgi:hypothetical protein